MYCSCNQELYLLLRKERDERKKNKFKSQLFLLDNIINQDNIDKTANFFQHET